MLVFGLAAPPLTATAAEVASTNLSVSATVLDSCVVTASAGKRYMKSSANDLLPYTITSDAAHTTAVGIDGALYTGALTAVTPNTFPVYGQIPAGSYAAGVYTDTVRVTLNY